MRTDVSKDATFPDHLGVASAALRTYGQQANAAGDQIASIDLQKMFERVASMLPGAKAGTAAARCTLAQEVPEWGRPISAQGDKVASGDEAYSENELATGGIFDGLFGG